MSRALTTSALQAIFAQETGEAILFLVKLDHADWAAPIYLVNNNVDVVSNGDTYKAFPVEVTLPGEAADKIADVTLRVCNVSREIIASLRALSSSPSVEVSVVFASSPDTIEAGPCQFLLKDYSYDQFTVEGTLGYEDTLNEPIPAHTFTPSHFPGLFGGS